MELCFDAGRECGASNPSMDDGVIGDNSVLRGHGGYNVLPLVWSTVIA
jgi:hypothetical protein